MTSVKSRKSVKISSGKQMGRPIGLKITTLAGKVSESKICRIVIAGNYSREFDDARKILENVVNKIAVNNDFNFQYLMTCGGFIEIPWINGDFNQIVEHAKTWGIKLLDGIEIESSTRYLTIGIDSYSHTSSLRRPHVELVGLYDTHKDRWHFTGKSYPTVDQVQGLIRADLGSHFIELQDKLLILGCHDLTMFNPRAIKTAGSWRKSIIEQFLEKARKFKPDVVLHHPHVTDSKFTWLVSWRKLERMLDSVQHYASGIVYYNDVRERSGLDEVLEYTKKGEVLDLVVEVC